MCFDLLKKNWFNKGKNSNKIQLYHRDFWKSQLNIGKKRKSESQYTIGKNENCSKTTASYRTDKPENYQFSVSFEYSMTFTEGKENRMKSTKTWDRCPHRGGVPQWMVIPIVFVYSLARHPAQTVSNYSFQTHYIKAKCIFIFICSCTIRKNQYPKKIWFYNSILLFFLENWKSVLGG